MNLPKLTIELPQWIIDQLSTIEILLPQIEDRMRFVIELAQRNVEEQTGGPFAAAVFDDNGKLISAGVNLVENNNCSILHAEIISLALAQKITSRFDLGAGGKLQYQLVTSTEPCAMCYGAVPWSGISSLVCGAREEDAMSIGFDEGPKLKNWAEELELRGIEVQRDILREEAAAVLKYYAESDGTIYNSAKAIAEK